MKTYLPGATLTMAILATITLSFTQSIHAATLTYEGFTGYPNANNNIVGQNGGTGWGAAWDSPSSDGFLHTVRTPTAISYPGYTGSTTPAASGGNYLNLASAFGGSNPTSVFRALDTSAGGAYGINGYLLSPNVIGADNATLWGSFLYSNDDVGQGISTKTLQLEGGGTFTFTLPQTASSNLLVFRMDFGASATDTITTFYNPNLATFDGTTGGVTSAPGNYSFNTIRLTETYSNGGQGSEGQYDDIRFGQTLADVAPVPEPATVSFLGLGTLALIVRRKARARRA